LHNDFPKTKKEARTPIVKNVHLLCKEMCRTVRTCLPTKQAN
jgi:hypothetical protein